MRDRTRRVIAVKRCRTLNSHSDLIDLSEKDTFSLLSCSGFPSPSFCLLKGNEFCPHCNRFCVSVIIYSVHYSESLYRKTSSFACHPGIETVTYLHWFALVVCSLENVLAL